MTVMKTKKAYLFGLAFVFVFSFSFSIQQASAGYGEGAYYGEGTYYGYGQVLYYAQVSYYTTPGNVFTTPVTIRGNLTIEGSFHKGSGTFLIDHPLDPANKLLFHSFVESPDVKNIYDGLAEVDQNGEAEVQLPTYFEALNKDFRYQVKPLDKPAPNLYIKSEVKENRFTIAGGTPGGKVSWQVTGIRHDPYIVANPIIPEVEKGPDQIVDKGEYLYEGYASDWKLKLQTIFSKALDFMKTVFR